MKRITIVFISLILFLSACSTSEEARNQNDKSSVKLSVEEMLKEGPGTYAENKYHQLDFRKVLDQLPDGISAEEAFRQLKGYLAEDYATHVEEIKRVDPAFYTNLQQSQPDDPSSPNTPSDGKGSQTAVNVVILLDASGSMRGTLDGKVKMALAKEEIKKFVSKLPQGTSVSLKVYGHKGSGSNRDKALSCGSIETVYPLGEYNAQKFQAALNRFQPNGWTPLAKAIEDSAQDFGQQTEPGTKNVIYVVSDGKETCDGDPVQAAKKLNQSQIQAIVNIIGFDVKNEEQKALKEIAAAGQGEYIRADTPEQLQRELEREAMEKRLAWSRWGDRTWSMIQNEWQQKYYIIHRHYQDLSYKLTQESNRLNHSAHYLFQQNKLDNQEYTQLRNLIDTRIQTIRNHYQSVFDEKNESLKGIRDQLQDQVRKKSEEMQKQVN